MIVVIDNYDSFTYNLVQYLDEVGGQREPITVYRNDAITPKELSELPCSRIVISPGPCTPDEAGVSVEVVRKFAGKLPILGICLGHQAIGQALGGKVVRAPLVMHGKTSLVYHSYHPIFDGTPESFVATRYHSLIVERESLPEDFEVIAWTEDELIMGISHRLYPHLVGLQFHPESVMTDVGKTLLKNFLSFNGT